VGTAAGGRLRLLLRPKRGRTRSKGPRKETEVTPETAASWMNGKEKEALCLAMVWLPPPPLFFLFFFVGDA